MPFVSVCLGLGKIFGGQYHYTDRRIISTTFSIYMHKIESYDDLIILQIFLKILTALAMIPIVNARINA